MDNISLLREKFVLRDIGVDEPPVIALGNRITVNLPKQKDQLVVRGHSMHVTLRYAAEVMRQLSYVSHVERGVDTLLQWDTLWAKVVDGFEKEAVPHTWIVVYYRGEVVYSDNAHHILFDIIEQCEFKNRNVLSEERYKKSIVMAQKAFQKMGRNVMIEEESHVGFILDKETEELKFAIILRMPGHKSTFTTRILKNKKQQIKPHDFNAMVIAADYIEAINMAVRTGFMERAIQNTDGSVKDQVKEVTFFNKRLQRLSLGIEQAERKYDLFYRPERPDFKLIKRKCIEEE